ncbi:3D domain-containing protein [Cytobacillus oceanisediminis]|uniref:3D domain-containing protein n=1 Tax=Cytobacillus oceanisediminis TaxID=665099 RepID=UPI001FB44134|nr:3D domain-containing protein [Cytobacillus oceanisediminis]UOE58190.1 hypothetical protein IRB79_27185 [Cytobacillus oceanisediminis]
MERKITKNIVIQNCLKIGAGIVVAGCVGFQFHENQELNKDLEALNHKYEKSVQELDEAAKANAQLLEQSQSLSQTAEKLKKDKGKLAKKSAQLEAKNKKLETKNTELEKSNRKLKLGLEAEKSQLRPVAKKPASQTVKVAEEKKPNKPAAKNVKTVVHGTASAYTASCNGCTGITASGERVERGMVAMAKWVPLGTKVRITSPAAPHVNGVYTVADRGGAIKGNRVDIFMESHSKAVAFGMKEVKIEILN